MPRWPNLSKEKKYGSLGFTRIVGLDEAGRGPLAGPVVAAAAWLPAGFRNFGLRDSKLTGEKERERLFALIGRSGIVFSVGIVNQRDIDRINIYEASQLAMRKAVARLPFVPDMLLVDGMRLKGVPMEQERVVKGDLKVLSIAAASVVAKVVRDRIMARLHEALPQYNFARHKGYPTAEHVRLLEKHGVSYVHRRSYAPVARLLGN
jgi:ribonuclease HII